MYKITSLKGIFACIIKQSNKEINKVNYQAQVYSKSNNGFKTIRGNHIIGNLRQYEAKMRLKGIGYNMKLEEGILLLNLGNKTPLRFAIPDDIRISIHDETERLAKSSDLLKLTQFLSYIRMIKPAYKDRYKGKGFRQIEVTIINNEK